MKRSPHHALRFVALAATLVAAACADQVSGPSTSARSGDVPVADQRFALAPATATLRWEATARSLVASHAVNPIAAARVYALESMANYAAVVAADGNYEGPGGGRALYEARRGAIAGAGATILGNLFPDAAAALADSVASQGAAGPGGTHPQFTRGVAIGREAGKRMIGWATSDGFSAGWNGQPPSDPLGGGWVSLVAGAPAGFQFPTMRPYYLMTQSQFRPASHPARGSAAFLAALDDVRQAALHRNADSVVFANFWNLSNGTITALGYWDERLAENVAEHGLDEREASHLFALTNSAAMDAVIGCWEAKYYYVLLRPSMADGSITRSPGVPGFPYGLPNHPSYPSGHSCVSASAAQVISAYFPEDAASLATQVAAAGRSRVVGGIHYPFDVSAGQTLGRQVADWAMAYDRRPGGILAALDR